jgi:hypothetical protein
MQSRGIPPENVAILVKDEPFDKKGLEAVLRIGRAIRRGSNFKMFNDLHFGDPATAPPVYEEVLREACDIQCFNVHQYFSAPGSNQLFIESNRRAGLQWWCYMGVTDRLVDPYEGWLLRMWFCFDKGLTGAQWFLSDGAGGFAWDEYFNYGPSRTPLYLARDSVTTSKAMEAMREGAQDYEILTMLKNAQLQQKPGPLHDSMGSVLSNRVRQVLVSHTLALYPWNTSKDRSMADSVRAEALHLLAASGVE